METNKKTFFQRWNNNEPGTTNLGSFQTKLMELYRLADSDNQERLQKAYPEYFVFKPENS